MSLSINEIYSRSIAEKRWFLENHGNRVEVFQDEELKDMSVWCRIHCKSRFDHSYDRQLINFDVYNRSIKVANGELADPKDEEDWMERSILDQLSCELSREIDRDILKQLGLEKIPLLYFWFEDREEAIMFKLKWGG